MAPSTHMEQLQQENSKPTNSNHKEYQHVYTHKKFGNRVVLQRSKNVEKAAESPMNQQHIGQTNVKPNQQSFEEHRKPQEQELFRPYALNDKNTPRKRRISENAASYDGEQQQHRVKRPAVNVAYVTGHTLTAPPTAPPPFYGMSYDCTPVPELNRQAFAVILQKQREVLQIRQWLDVNPDTNTWPMEWRNVLYNMLN